MRCNPESFDLRRPSWKTIFFFAVRPGHLLFVNRWRLCDVDGAAIYWPAAALTAFYNSGTNVLGRLPGFRLKAQGGKVVFQCFSAANALHATVNLK